MSDAVTTPTVMDNEVRSLKSPRGERLEVVHHELERYFCPVLDHFVETHPEYVPLIDERVPGSWSRRDHRERATTPAAAPS